MVKKNRQSFFAIDSVKIKIDHMVNRFSRTALVMGEESIQKLQSCRVALFGIGGVGGNCLEALVRAGVGTIDIIDDDQVSLTNINRQIIATTSVVGKDKTEVAIQRMKDINPDVVIIPHTHFYLPDDPGDIDFSKFDYVIDAIDTVSAKLSIISEAKKRGIPVISSMGCGNRMDPTKLVITDVFRTQGDPLSKVMRAELRKRGIKELKVCCSTELPIPPLPSEETCPEGKRQIPGSTPFVPTVCGIMLAYEVVKDLTSFDGEKRRKEWIQQRLNMKKPE